MHRCIDQSPDILSASQVILTVTVVTVAGRVYEIFDDAVMSTLPLAISANMFPRCAIS